MQQEWTIGAKKLALIIHTHLENVEMHYTLIMEINISKSNRISTSNKYDQETYCNTY